MKVAVFTDTYLPAVDGVVNSLLATKEYLESLGHEVLLFAPADRNNGAQKEAGVIYCPAREFRKYPGYRMANPFYPRATKIMKKNRVDIVHSHGIAVMGLKGMWGSRECEVPMVQTFHTMVMDALSYYNPVSLRLPFMRWITKYYLRFFLHHVKAVVVPTGAIGEELKALAPHVRRMEIIPTGVDINRFNPKVDGSRVRRKWRLDGSKLILNVGRISPEKNIGLLLKAFKLVRQREKNVKLMFVGSGPALGKYKNRVKNEGLERDVIFTGFVDDKELPEYYAACDAFAIASKFETQALVVLEAMATGRCVAGANFRAIPEFVKDKYTGHIFDPDDEEDCAEALLASLGGEERICTSARMTAENYSIDNCSRRLLEVYESLIEENGWHPH